MARLFFQAEDGIRDKLVTGVQTCALPIFPRNTLHLPVADSPTQAGVSTTSVPLRSTLLHFPPPSTNFRPIPPPRRLNPRSAPACRCRLNRSAREPFRVVWRVLWSDVEDLVEKSGGGG